MTEKIHLTLVIEYDQIPENMPALCEPFNGGKLVSMAAWNCVSRESELEEILDAHGIDYPQPITPRM